MRVLLVAPVPPPYGGMALQARQLEALLRKDGVDVELFPSNFALPRVLQPLARVPGVRTMLRALLIGPKLWSRLRDATVVHVLAASWLYFFVVVFPAVFAGHLRGRRVVLNYRGGEAREFFRRFGWLLTPAFHAADAVTAPSEFLASAIRLRFRIGVAVVPNILDSSLFSYRPRTSIRPALLVTRHLEKMYDIESVLKAYRVVATTHPDASLWIAGTGSEEARLRRLVVEWGLPDVRFLGEVEHRDLPGIYAQRDIYINASLLDNFPGALVEASAAGLVVVTTGAGGIPFMYQHGRTALIVDPGDWQQLAAAVEDALQNPSRAGDIARAALAIVRACDWSEVRQRLFESYGLPAAPDATAGARLDGAPCAAG